MFKTEPSRNIMYRHLLPPGYKDIVKQWIMDDCPTFDVGGFVVGEKIETALLYCKSSAVLAGVPFADAIFEQLDLQCTWKVEEGSYIDVVQDGGPNHRVVAAEVTGYSYVQSFNVMRILHCYYML